MKLQGLKNAAQYNERVAIVVEQRNLTTGRWGVQLLDHGSDWENDAQKQFGGKQIAAKEANLVRTKRDSVVWQISHAKGVKGGKGPSVWETIQGTPHLAQQEYCDEFCQGLWNCFFETIPGIPLTIDHGMKWRRELLTASGHKIFYLSLEAVQHYLLIEKCCGRYRVFQSYVKISEDTGYTAGEWCRLDALPRNKTHKKNGGGLTVGDNEINELLDAIVELQGITKALIKPLLKDNPRVDESSIALLTRNLSELSSSEMDQATSALQDIVRWTGEVRDNVGPLGITTVGATSDPVVILQANQVLFQIPQKYYRSVNVLNEKLTGEHYLSPVIFVDMLHRGIWWEHCQNPEDGGAVGFTVRCAALDVLQSYEEGLAAAQEKSAYIRGS